MSILFNENDARKAFYANCEDAKEMVNDVDEMEKFLQRLERKLKDIPAVGNQLSKIPVMISLVKSYTKGEYKEVPIGTIIAIVGALIYFLSPVDLVPDAIPVIGYLDDAVVITACWRMVYSDIEEYREWRRRNGKEI